LTEGLTQQANSTDWLTARAVQDFMYNSKDVRNMISFREKNNALIKIYISAEKYITLSDDSTNKLQHLSVTIRSSVIRLS